MTILSVWSALHYLTEIEGITWRGVDHDARCIVKCIKREPYNGYVSVKLAGESIVFQHNKNEKEFLTLLTTAMGRRLTRLISGKISIVPIPNSGMALGCGTSFPSVEMATGIAATYGKDAEVAPVIFWNKPKQKTHLSAGYRHPDNFQALMRLVGKPGHRVVIFDDVLTSGSQMTAAARILTENGFPPALGMVGAKVTKVQLPNMLGWTMSEIELDRGIIDIGDL